jgi:small GTP-binding protein
MASKDPKTLKSGIKIVVVGDGAVGKTSLLVSAVTGKFPKEYIPTVFDNHEIDRVVDGESSHAILYDTAGQEEYESLRLLSYPDTDIFLLVFSVDSANSFDNLGKKWLKEVREYGPNTPCLFIGAKADLRDDDGVLAELQSLGKTMHSKEVYQAKSAELGAAGYVECSAVKQENIGFVIDEAIRLARKAKAANHAQLAAKASQKSIQTSSGGCCVIC